MADNYLMLDGKKYALSDDLISALRPAVAEPEKKSSFQWDIGKNYWYIGSGGGTCVDANTNADLDEKRHAVANYCTDKALMEQRAMHETLNRLLWRYSEEHGGDNPWDGISDHWVIITADGDMQKIVPNYFNSSKLFGVTYFCDAQTALSAIEEIVKPFLAAHPDFV